jgi:hypothetical protein
MTATITEGLENQIDLMETPAVGLPEVEIEYKYKFCFFCGALVIPYVESFQTILRCPNCQVTLPTVAIQIPSFKPASESEFEDHEWLNTNVRSWWRETLRNAKQIIRWYRRYDIQAGIKEIETPNHERILVGQHRFATLERFLRDEIDLRCIECGRTIPSRGTRSARVPLCDDHYFEHRRKKVRENMERYRERQRGVILGKRPAVKRNRAPRPIAYGKRLKLAETAKGKVKHVIS